MGMRLIKIIYNSIKLIFYILYSPPKFKFCQNLCLLPPSVSYGSHHTLVCVYEFGFFVAVFLFLLNPFTFSTQPPIPRPL